VGKRCHPGRIGRAAHPHVAGRHVDPDQDVGGAGVAVDLGDGEDQPGGRVVDRGTGDPEGVDVTARKRRERNRRTDVGLPLHLSGCRVEGIERIPLGRDEDSVADDQGLGVNGAVERGAPSA
jgi:hypothetical protein